MSTITAGMPCPVSAGNALSTAKPGAESGSTLFGDIMKAQNGQNQGSPGTEAKTEGQDKDPVKVQDKVPGENADETKGMPGSWQYLNLLLIPGMPMPPIADTTDNVAAAEGSGKAAPTVPVSEGHAGATRPDAVAGGRTEDVAAAAKANVKANVNANAAINAAAKKDTEPDTKTEAGTQEQRTVTTGHSGIHTRGPLPTVDKAAGAEVPRSAETLAQEVGHGETDAAVQPRAEGSSGNGKAKPAEGNAGQDKTSAIKEKQGEHPMQEAAMRSHMEEGTQATEGKAAGKPESWKADIRPEYMDQLKTHITDSLAAGKREFEIQLNPANLGKLVIKASYEAGRAVISIVCSEAKTMQAMSQQARELAGMVENRTGNHTIVVVERPTADYLEQQGNQQGGGQEGSPDRGQKQEKNPQLQEELDFLQQLRLGLA